MYDNKDFKIVITGKGGVGKTTLTSCIAKLLAMRGMNVLAVDEDPQMNLPYALGLPIEEASKIVPLNKNLDYIEEKTGVRPGKSWGSLFRLNPRVEDVVQRFGIKVDDNLNLLVMGTVVQAAAGCLCAENVLLDSVIKHLALRDNEVIILDTQAGVEHFGRALSKGFSQCLVISDSTFNALSVAKHSAELARQIGIPYVHLIINKVKNNNEKQLTRFETMTQSDFSNLFDSVFYLPSEPRFEALEPDVTRIFYENSLYIVEISKLVESLLTFQKYHKQKTLQES
ncbi:ATP-binding cassette domain-containing protein [Deferribacter autotrophicus]|uniref:ATP-binding cassette domain-containing protein n=1 Tax=Deferribacter autotrophicus TaxID=500465 RepID=A0A5A8EYY3_9BACT|nr:AAA family ATPase [Deferribacter autotrophicus]KAA0256871.1 ATP-binding cassette domain-containing protein [Deferribacter autotrophicus]